ncbi:hypothetical protein CVT24_004706 [Panaeolus cyanescens]|uniref:DUF6697 domain-containing protein n=1 Tax=Panaeolus cyanescens TaxID=181874 RepID=A0A409YSN5_9AGAR|nr:hypothetical protein CVT24_004706 [Panaeolus cyanescens]
MDELQIRITQLEESNRALIAERDKLKKLATLYQEAAFQEKLNTLEITEKYDEKRAGELEQHRVQWEAERMKEVEKMRKEMGHMVQEWEKKRENERKAHEEEKARLEAQHAKEKVEWEKDVEKLRVEMECSAALRLDEECRRWKDASGMQKARWEEERSELQRVIEGERLRRVTLEAQLLQLQKSGRGVQNPDSVTAGSRDASMTTPHAQRTTIREIPTPQPTHSPSPPTQPLQVKQEMQLCAGQPEQLTSNDVSASSTAIIDLSRDSPSPSVKIERTPTPVPEVISIDSDDEELTHHDPPSMPHASTSTSLSAIPTSTSIIAIKKKQAKSEAFILSSARRTQYLKGTSLYPITPSFIPISISRMVLTRLYGSKTMGLHWESSDDKHKLMTPSYEWNPDMPRAPGEPGLLLITYNDVAKKNPWALFYKLEGSKTVRWGYAGEYVCTEVGNVMGEEFAEQSDIVKHTWGTNVCARRAEGAMLHMRARMTLRKHLNRAPTEDEILAEASKIKRTNMPSYNLTAQDVVDSLVSGEEHIKVMSLQCVGYSHDRARQLQAEHEKWEVDEAAKKSRKVKSGSTSKFKSKATRNDEGKSKGKKRAREPSVEVLSSEGEDGGDEGQEVEERASTPKRRKTTRLSTLPVRLSEEASGGKKDDVGRDEVLEADFGDDGDDSDFYLDD